MKMGILPSWAVETNDIGFFGAMYGAKNRANNMKPENIGKAINPVYDPRQAKSFLDKKVDELLFKNKIADAVEEERYHTPQRGDEKRFTERYSSYEAQQYQKYKKEGAQGKKGQLDQDYSPLDSPLEKAKKDKSERKFGYDPLDKAERKEGESVSYDPFASREQSKDGKKDIGKLADYALLAVQHSYLNKGARHYIAANSKYAVSASEGFIKEEALAYLAVSVKDRYGNSLGNYRVMLKYDDDQERRVFEDKKVVDELEKVLEGIEKGNVGEKILEAIKEIIKNRKNADNLSIEMLEAEILEKTLKEKKCKFRTNELILLLEEQELRLKKRKLKAVKAASLEQKEMEDAQQNIIRRLDYNPAMNYPLAKLSYAQQRNKKLNDFTHLAPAKFVEKFPKTMMGGVLGFTYLGEGFMGIRDDLYGEEAFEVELHEAIHTDDEYETRVITKWMLDDDTHFH